MSFLLSMVARLLVSALFRSCLGSHVGEQNFYSLQHHSPRGVLLNCFCSRLQVLWAPRHAFERPGSKESSLSNRIDFFGFFLPSLIIFIVSLDLIFSSFWAYLDSLGKQNKQLSGLGTKHVSFELSKIRFFHTVGCVGDEAQHFCLLIWILWRFSFSQA